MTPRMGSGAVATDDPRMSSGAVTTDEPRMSSGAVATDEPLVKLTHRTEAQTPDNHCMTLIITLLFFPPCSFKDIEVYSPGS